MIPKRTINGTRDVQWLNVTILLIWLIPIVAIAASAQVDDDCDSSTFGERGRTSSWFSCASLLGHRYRRPKRRPSRTARNTINSAFVEHYRCPEQFATFAQHGPLSTDHGYFRFGPETICYGRCSTGLSAASPALANYDALTNVTVMGRELRLPFNPSEIAENLRLERYAAHDSRLSESTLRSAYYLMRPLLGVSVRKHLQRIRLRDWQDIAFPQWPVDATVENLFEQLLGLLLTVHPVESIPFVWFWPDGFESCVTMTHDIETSRGLDYCSRLMDLDDEHRIKSSFQIIPDGRYRVSKPFLEDVHRRGFEINIHDLNHDGRLFSNKALFLERSLRINRYAQEYDAVGFRSAILYRNPEWLEALEFDYDMSIPTIGHLDAQRGGCCSVLPFFIGPTLELPVTTTQDYSLFHILNDYSIDIWRRQTEAIKNEHGLVHFIIHPDYIIEPRAHDVYVALLSYLNDIQSAGNAWFALPGEINSWWRDRSDMTLVCRGDTWQIEGPGKERARVAYASLEDGRVIYRM